MAVSAAVTFRYGEKTERATFSTYEAFFKGLPASFKSKKVEVDLIWFNKTRNEADVDESPVDIVIAVNGVNRYFIEVKSTNDKRNPYFYITGNEWKYMQTYREKSILVRVYNTQSQEPFFEVFKDPFRMIMEGLIQFNSGGRFQLMIPDDEHDASFYSLKDYQDDEIGCKIS